MNGNDVGLDPQGEARQALASAVRDYGPRVLSNPPLLNNLFKDLLPGSPREASLLVAAAEGSSASMLEQQVAGVGPDTAVRSIAGNLARSRALDPAACLWAVSEFARVMGYPVSEGPPAPAQDPGATLPWPGPAAAAAAAAAPAGPPPPAQPLNAGYSPPTGPAFGTQGGALSGQVPGGPTGQYGGPPGGQYGGPPGGYPGQPAGGQWGAPGGPMQGPPPGMGPGGPPPGMGGPGSQPPQWGTAPTPPSRGRGGLFAVIAAIVVIVIVAGYIGTAAVVKLPPFAKSSPKPSPVAVVTPTPTSTATPTAAPSASETSSPSGPTAATFNLGNTFDFSNCENTAASVLGLTDPNYFTVMVAINCSSPSDSALYSDFHDGDYFLTSGNGCQSLTDCLPDYMTSNGSCSTEPSSDYVDGNVTAEDLCDLSGAGNAEDYVLYASFDSQSSQSSYYNSLLDLNGMTTGVGTCSSEDFSTTADGSATFCENTYTMGSSSSTAGDLFQWDSSGS